MDDLILTDQTFAAEVLQEQAKPVLVDFWASWCAPCRVQDPIVKTIAEEFRDRVKVGKLEVDENPQTAQSYQILSIPTIAIFKDGQIVWQGIGVQTKDKLVTAIEQQLG